MKKNTRFADAKKSARPPGGRAAGPAKGGASFQAKTFVKGGAAPVMQDRPSEGKQRAGSFIDIPKSHRIIIGTHAIFEAAMTFPKDCKELWMKQGWESNQDLKKIASELRPHGISVKVIPDTTLDRFGSHQGAILTVSSRPEIDWTEIERAREATVLVLDGIEDPHNLGAILRTSWLMGVKGLLIPQDRAVGLTPTVHKVACGGAEHVPVEETTNFAGHLENLKKQGYWVFGLSHKGKRSLFDQKIPAKVVWCIGAEDKGLRTTTERLCDELVSIPQVSAAASYNASVATAIALTETLRQRTRKTNEKS
ncbi:MAG: 23S rRNA (guanosine(2251)-2'-O)-methyltransferase RlmB [Bdellovibrio sp.]|jgi:23S rRNA (guanosine2251-2'-O)-methyltransferase